MPTITFSFDVTAGEATRVQAAFGSVLHPQDPTTPATQAEIKEHIRKQLIRITREYEKNQAELALQVPADINPV